MLTKTFTALTLIAAMGLMGLAMTPAQAADTAEGEAQPMPRNVSGVIGEVSGDEFTLMHGAENNEETTFKVSDTTVYMKDGAEAEKDEVLKADTSVTVTHRGDQAAIIAARTQQQGSDTR